MLKLQENFKCNIHFELKIYRERVENPLSRKKLQIKVERIKEEISGSEETEGGLNAYIATKQKD